ncbi:MAG: hypothetical protein AB7O38_24670 [Pirellulaceae bacterium]
MGALHVLRGIPLQCHLVLQVPTPLRDAARRGYRTTYAYDAAARLTSRRYPDGSRATFAYDSVGNRTQMRDLSGLYSFSYDSENRFGYVGYPIGARATYAYDARSWVSRPSLSKSWTCTCGGMGNAEHAEDRRMEEGGVNPPCALPAFSAALCDLCFFSRATTRASVEGGPFWAERRGTWSSCSVCGCPSPLFGTPN